MKNSEDKEDILQKIALSARDCIIYRPIREILEGIIEAATITLVSGREKIGKTYVLLVLALCMAIERPWLGLKTMQDVKGKVLWIDLDQNRDITMRRINQITNGIEESWAMRNENLFDNFILLDRQSFKNAGCNDSFQFSSKSDAVEFTKNLIIENNVKVCIIDNLVQIEGEADENSANHIQFVFSGLKQFLVETQCAQIIIHHTDKSGNRGRGSSAIFGETDLNLQLEPCENENELKLITDGARNTGKHEIGMRKEWKPRLSEDGVTELKDENGHIIYNFRLLPVNAKDIRIAKEVTSRSRKSYYSFEANINAITELFRGNGNKPLSQTAITKLAKLTGGNQKRIECVIEATNRGILIQDNIGRYRLNTNNEGGEEDE